MLEVKVILVPGAPLDVGWHGGRRVVEGVAIGLDGWDGSCFARALIGREIARPEKGGGIDHGTNDATKICVSEYHVSSEARGRCSQT